MQKKKKSFVVPRIYIIDFWKLVLCWMPINLNFEFFHVDDVIYKAIPLPNTEHQVIKVGE